jgi:hypothetical protein
VERDARLVCVTLRCLIVDDNEPFLGVARQILGRRAIDYRASRPAYAAKVTSAGD